MSVAQQKLIICLALTLGTAGVFWPVHRYEFVNLDDAEYVIENPHLRTGFASDRLKWAFTTGYDSNWHPLTWLSHMVDVRLFGLNAGPHHAVNLLFHSINTLLLFIVMARMTRDVWPSALVAALFAWHPLHVESVAWIAERKDVLSTCFALLTLWVYASYAESGQRKYLFLALFWFALGLMAKPMLVTLPFVLLLLDYWPLGRLRKKESGASPEGEGDFLNRLIEKAPFLILSAASSFITYGVQKGRSVTALESLPVRHRILNALLSYGSYMYKALFPFKLAVIYPIPFTFSWWQIAAATSVLVAISIAVVCWAGRRPWLLTGWLWFLGTLVPVIGLVQVGRQAMADRYTYLPLVGLFIMLAWSWAEFTANSRFGSKASVAVAALVLFGALLLTSRQVRTWSNSQALFAHAIEVTKDNYFAHNSLGRVFANSGRFEEAQAQFEEVLRTFPNFPEAHFSMGVLLARKGKYQEAVAHYKEAVETHPDATTHFNFGNALMKLGRADEAIAHFAEAARLDPQLAEAQNNWGYVLTTDGRLREAAQHYTAALRINPGLTEARLNLARIYEELGETH